LSIFDSSGGFLARSPFCREFAPFKSPKPLAMRGVGFEIIDKMYPFVEFLRTQKRQADVTKKDA
jgi:hypothetical protein